MKDTSYVYRIASTVITDSRAFFSGNVELEERVVPSPKVWKLLLVTHSGILSEIPAVSESLREKKANPNSDPSASACKSALLDLSENEVSPAPMFTPWGHAAAPDAQSVSSSLNVDRLGRAVFKNRRSAGEK